MNRLKTLLLLTALTVLFIFVGQIIGGRQGMIIAFGFAVLMNFFSYWFSDKMVLRMYRAQQVTEAEAPQLVQQVRIQAQQAGLPMPRVYIIPNASPNAFATGRNPDHAAIAFTQGILDLLAPDELDGVIAHELAHVKNRDILTQSIAATVAGAISMLANMVYWGAMFGGYGGGSRSRNSGGSMVGLLIMAIVAPIAAMFIQMAISRSREFAADATGARTSGRPLSLANALRKLHAGVHRQPMNATTATAHMFILNPLTRQSFASLFATHPPVEERIARLEKLAYSR